MNIRAIGLVIFAIAIVMFSVVVHESVHWVQAEHDDRVEPVNMTIYIGEAHFGDLAIPALAARTDVVFVTEDPGEIAAFKEKVEYYEIEAYTIQIIFILLMIGLYVYKFLRR